MKGQTVEVEATYSMIRPRQIRDLFLLFSSTLEEPVRASRQAFLWHRRICNLQRKVYQNPLQGGGVCPFQHSHKNKNLQLTVKTYFLYKV